MERTFKCGVHLVTNLRTQLNPDLVEGTIVRKAKKGRVYFSGLDEEDDAGESDTSNTETSTEEEDQGEPEEVVTSVSRLVDK